MFFIDLYSGYFITFDETRSYLIHNFLCIFTGFMIVPFLFLYLFQMLDIWFLYLFEFIFHFLPFPNSEEVLEISEGIKNASKEVLLFFLFVTERKWVVKINSERMIHTTWKKPFRKIRSLSQSVWRKLCLMFVWISASLSPSFARLFNRGIVVPYAISLNWKCWEWIEFETKENKNKQKQHYYPQSPDSMTLRHLFVHDFNLAAYDFSMLARFLMIFSNSIDNLIQNFEKKIKIKNKFFVYIEAINNLMSTTMCSQIAIFNALRCLLIVVWLPKGIIFCPQWFWHIR